MRRLRLQPVPVVMDDCVLCGEREECIGYDHDLRGHVCRVDYRHVMRAELALINIAHCEIPSGSLFDCFGFADGGLI